MSWLDNAFSNEISEDGDAVPQRKRVDFVGATVEDVPAEDLTRITITGGGGADLSDSPARSVAESSAAGTSGSASRADHVHAHGSLPGGSLHEAAVASVAGVGGSAGFASPIDKERTDQVPQMLLDIAALPSTYAPIVHTHAHSSLTGLTTGDPHTQYVLRTDGDVIGNSNKYLIRDAQARAQARGLVNTSNSTPAELFGANNVEVTAGTNPSNTTAGVAITARGGGIKLQVNDATTPATVRTVLEVVREAGGPGTADLVQSFGRFACGDVNIDPADPNRISGDGVSIALGIDYGELRAWGWALKLYSGTQYGYIGPDFISTNFSTATAGQIRLSDGEILNAKGSTGSEACLVSYDKTAGQAIFGSDGAGARTAATAVLAGSTEANLVAGSLPVLQARPTQVRINGAQLSVTVKSQGTVSTTTKTIDCADGNVHTMTLSASSTCTVSLSNTKAGAEFELFVTKSGSGVGVTLSSTWFDGTFCAGWASGVKAFATNGTIYVRGRVHADGGKCFVTEFAAL